jgi:hypothetical protein
VRFVPTHSHRQAQFAVRAGRRAGQRRVLLHVIAETGQPAGHVDIIRTFPDYAKPMGPSG